MRGRDIPIVTTRQTITSDFYLMDSALKVFIEPKGTRPEQYYWSNRCFTALDIECLADSVQSNPAIAPDEKNTLINKLKTLLSAKSARGLHLKNAAYEKMYGLSEENVEKISFLRQAIKNGKLITFEFLTYAFAKSAEPERQRCRAYAFPLEIIYTEGRPMLCACCDHTINETQPNKHLYMPFVKQEENFIQFFDIACIEKLRDNVQDLKHKENRAILPEYETILEKLPEAITTYAAKKEKVSIRCSRDLLPLIYARFGTAVTIDNVTDTTFRAIAETAVTPELLGWVFSLGNSAKLLTPLHAVQRMKQWIKAARENYGI